MFSFLSVSFSFPVSFVHSFGKFERILDVFSFQGLVEANTVFVLLGWGFGQGNPEERVLLLHSLGVFFVFELDVLYFLEFHDHVHSCNSSVNDRANLQGVEEKVEGTADFDSSEPPSSKQGETDLFQESGSAPHISVLTIYLNLLQVLEPVARFRLSFLTLAFSFLPLGLVFLILSGNIFFVFISGGSLNLFLSRRCLSLNFFILFCLFLIGNRRLTGAHSIKYKNISNIQRVF